MSRSEMGKHEEFPILAMLNWPTLPISSGYLGINVWQLKIADYSTFPEVIKYTFTLLQRVSCVNYKSKN